MPVVRMPVARVLRRSSTTTSSPASASRRAVCSPARPAPTTRTSADSLACHAIGGSRWTLVIARYLHGSFTRSARMDGVTTLAEALERGTVVLDGGLATQLEAAGHDLSDDLWSARLLRDDPE